MAAVFIYVLLLAYLPACLLLLMLTLLCVCCYLCAYLPLPHHHHRSTAAAACHQVVTHFDIQPDNVIYYLFTLFVAH